MNCPLQLACNLNFQQGDIQRWWKNSNRIYTVTLIFQLYMMHALITFAPQSESLWFGALCTTKLMAHNWQKWKRVFLTYPWYKIYRDEAVGLKSCKYTWKITVFVKMWNLGQCCENLIFCQYLLNWSWNLNILLHMCETYNCDYLKHSTFRFNFIDFQLNTDFPSQFCVFLRKIT